MAENTPDLRVFDTIELVVSDLVQRRIYPEFHLCLTEIVRESEDLLECLQRLDALLHQISDAQQRCYLPDVWHADHAAQIRELERGSQALIAVLTNILPQRALKLLNGVWQ